MKISVLIFLALIASGCRYQSELETLNSLELDRIYLEQNSNSGLDKEKQEAINRYFSNVKELAHRFNTDNRFSRNFHRRFFSSFSEDLCSRFVLGSKAWKKVLDSCEVSGFNLCAEEAKHYQDILQLVRPTLTDLEVDSLKKEPECKERLLKLGVFNENV